MCEEGLSIDPRSRMGRKARMRHGAQLHPDTPEAVFRIASTTQTARSNGRRGNIDASNRAVVDFIQREKRQEKDECKLFPFQIFDYKEYGCVKCGRIRRSRKNFGKCAWSAKNEMRACTRRHKLDPEQIRHVPPPPMFCDEREGRKGGEVEVRERNSVDNSGAVCDSAPSGLRGGHPQPESDSLAKAVAAAQALLLSLVAFSTPGKNGGKKTFKLERKKDSKKKHKDAKEETEAPKVYNKDKPGEAPKAEAAEETELQAEWQKVLEKKNRPQGWNVLTADWTAEVMDVEKLAEGINDPGRAATSAVVGGRRRVARVTGAGRKCGKRRQAPSPLSPWVGLFHFFDPFGTNTKVDFNF